MPVVTLQEVTADTVRAVCNLVAEPTGFVAPNAVSMAQAHFHPEAWFRALYADDVLVGFVMLHDTSQRPEPPAEPAVFVWRFMIDRAHKRRGLGTAALQAIIAEVRRRHPTLARLGLSCVPGPGSPRPFYERLGFRFDGEMDEDEEVGWLDLRR